MTLLLTGLAEAQSGRRLPNQKTQPAAPPLSKETEKSESDKAPTEERKGSENKSSNKTPVLVTYFNQSVNSTRIYIDLVVSACASRLRDAGSVEVTVGNEMNRKEASDVAKNSTNAYVVLLQLETDSSNMNNSDYGGTYQDPRNLVVSYTVFEPQTGKSKTSGRTYPRANGTDPLSIPQTRANAEYRLKRAAEEAADRILRSFGQPMPPTRN